MANTVPMATAARMSKILFFMIHRWKNLAMTAALDHQRKKS